ncbi:hypothetical protein [Pseudomonas cichorii]|nr:hypothetical protein [Pseudomonas cichorii]
MSAAMGAGSEPKKQGYVKAEQERIDPRDIIEGDAFSWNVRASRE